MAKKLSLSISLSTDAKDSISKFRDLKKGVAETQVAFKDAQAETAKLAKALKAAGGNDASLAKQFEKARKEAGRLKGKLADQQAALQRQRDTLRGQGVDLKNLSGEWQRLTKAQERAAVKAKQSTGISDAKKILGLENSEREIRKVQAAFQRLKDSGQLSQREIAQAALKAKGRIIELRKESGSLVTQLAKVKEQAIGLGLALGGAIRAFSGGAGDLVQFRRKIGEISTLTDKTPRQLRGMGKQIRGLSQELGKDATDLAQATYNLISAGVPDEKFFSPLQLATKAAKAGVTDVNNAAGLGLGVINAYGFEINDLEQVYNVLFKTVKNGVTTIPELAANIGDALPSAKAAGVSFEELASSVALLTKGGVKTSKAVTAIRSAITQLAAPTPEARKRLQELGIEWRGLEDTIRQIRDSNLDLAGIRGIVPDTEGAQAVLALANNYEKLIPILDEARNSAGALDEAVGKIQTDDPAAIDRWVQTWAEFKRQLGEVVVVFIPLLSGLTALLAAFNELPGPIKVVIGGLLATVAAVKLFSGPVNLLLTALRGLANQGLASVATQAGKTGSALSSLGSRFGLFFAAVTGFGIGDYFYREFEVVRGTAITAIGNIHGYVERLLYFFKTIPLRIKDAWNSALDYVNDKISSVFRKGKARVSTMQATLDRQGSAASESAESVKAELERLEAKHKQTMARIERDTKAAVARMRRGTAVPASELGGDAGGPLPTPVINGTNPFGNDNSEDESSGDSPVSDVGASAIADLQRQIDLLGVQTERERILWEVQKGRYKDLGDKQKEALLNAAEALDNARLSESQDQAAKALRALLDPIQKIRQELSDYDKLLDAGKISWDEWAEATLRAQERMDELNGVATKTKPAVAQANQFAVQGARNMQSAFADFLFDPFQDGLKGMVRGFADAMRRILAELAAQQALKSLFGALSGLGGGVGSFFATASASVQHEGGMAGSGPMRSVPAMAFLGAPRYHSGSDVLGLKSDEIPAILQTGERVQSREEVAAMQQPQNQEISVALFDDRTSLDEYAASAAGQRTFIANAQRNATALKRVLGVKS